MLGHDRDAGTQANFFGLRQDVGDKDIVGGNWFPGDGMVLADPGLGKVELVGADDEFDIFLESCGAVFLRRMQRHHEGAEFHGMGSGLRG